MPTYRIQTDKGTYDIEADREPTMEEAMAAIGGQSAPAAAAPDASVSRMMRDPANRPTPAEAPQAPAQSAMQRFGDSVGAMGGMGGAQTGIIPQANAQSQAVYDKSLGSGLRTGAAQVPYLAAMAVPGGQGVGASGMLTSMGIRGGAMGAAYLANRAIEGEAPKLSEAAKQMVIGGMPIPQAATGPILSLATARNLGTGAMLGGGTMLAANAAEQALDDQPMTWDRYKASAKDAILPAIIGSAATGIGGKLQQMAKVQSEVEAGKAAAAELGMTDPMLGDVLPKRYGEMQQKVVAGSPEMAAKQAAARAPMVKAMLGIIGDAPKNEEIATQLQPIIGKLDALDAQYAKAQDRLQAAQKAMTEAKAATQLDPVQRANIIKGAQAETMAAIQDQAKAHIAQVAMADSIGTQTGHAEAVQDIVKKTFGARSQIASDMMAATGIPKEAAVIGQNELLTAATTALGEDANTVAGKSILETIKNWGSKGPQDAAATQQMSLQEMARKAAAQGKTEITAEEARAMLGAPKGQVYMPGQTVAQPANALSPVTDQKYLTLEDFRRLRDGISEGFYGKVDTNALNNAERLAGKAYSAMSDAHVGEIAKQFPDAVEPYNQFRAFWRDTSKIRDSDFGRALLRGEVSDSTIGAMANKLASGQEDEIRNFKRFVDTIKEQNPDVANAAMATMGSAVGNSFKQAAYDAASGGTDYRKLGNLLQSYASKKDAAFPVELFRMGDKETIAGWQKALRQFKPDDLTPSAVRSVMESPQIQTVLQTGGKDLPETMRVKLAEAAFNKRVGDAIALRQAGALQPARQAFAEAEKHANAAGIDAATARAAVDEAENNPIFSVFRGKGGYRLSNEAEKVDGSGTITDLVGNMKASEARTFMSKLREEKPDLADMVERRVLANTMKSFIGTEPSVPGELYRMKSDEVRRFFNPPSGETDTAASKLAAVIGNDRMSKLRRFAEGVSAINEGERAGKVAAKIPDTLVESARFGRTAATGSTQAGSSLATLIKRGQQWVGEKRFNLLSAALLDDGWMNSVNRSSGNIAEALGSLPAQKSYLLLQDARILGELGADPNKQQTNNTKKP